MCFSNLPVEFDDQGNPYLADEADDVRHTDRPAADDAPLDADPEGAYAAILEDIRGPVRREVAGTSDGEQTGRGTDGVESGGDDRREPGRGD